MVQLVELFLTQLIHTRRHVSLCINANQHTLRYRRTDTAIYISLIPYTHALSNEVKSDFVSIMTLLYVNKKKWDKINLYYTFAFIINPIIACNEKWVTHVTRI